jgi:hypothetical protein
MDPNIYLFVVKLPKEGPVRRRCERRRQSGVSLVELGAAMAFGLPLVFLVMYIILEANYFFTIRTNLDLAARQWAQIARENYMTSNSTSIAETTATTQVRIPHFVEPSVSQFIASWDTTNHPYSVTVTCFYPNGGRPSAGLYPFPCPDVFGFGNTFQINATATFPLEAD